MPAIFQTSSSNDSSADVRLSDYFSCFTAALVGMLCMLVSTNVSASVTGLANTIADQANVVSVNEGKLQGELDATHNVHIFKGVPFAAPPINELRWQAPQAPAKWMNIRSASNFAQQCVQLPLFDDMTFRASGMSEDCLYLNVWTPNVDAKKALPVLLYFYGGGFAAGDASEPRYDGASLAQQGMVVVTANYRLGLFGLLSHPELSAQTDYAGSGNYTFMDQAAALQWLVSNVSAFGGDPERITIGGESAGALSVNALMVSPLSKHNVKGAIGQSGSLLGPTLGAISLTQNEAIGSAMATALAQPASHNNDNGVASQVAETKPLSLAQLRDIPADELLKRATDAGFQWFLPTVDGYVFPQSPMQMYKNNDFAKVPLLAGNNSQEGSYQQILGEQALTQTGYATAIKALYPDHYERVLDLYSGTTETAIMDAAQALASDRFISFSTWNWADLVAKSNPTQVFYYEFSKVRPASINMPAGQPSSDRGAVHSAEIEYALGNLKAHPAYQWQDSDFKVSGLMQSYFVNFIKTGNPNTTSLPEWPLFSANKQLNINVKPIVEDITGLRPRYEFHRSFYELQ
jgi:para-nitrobenzyl esterase